MTQPMASRNSLSISVPITQTAVSFVSFVVASPLHAVSLSQLLSRAVQPLLILDHFKFLPFWGELKLAHRHPAALHSEVITP